MIYAFEVWARGEPHRRIVNSTTIGKAKADYWRDVLDFWPDVKFTDIVGRKVGAPHTSEAFLRTARYRGLPDLRCGEAVTVSGKSGHIVAHNDSANFDVLFSGGEWDGAVLNCHPNEIRRASHLTKEQDNG